MEKKKYRLHSVSKDASYVLGTWKCETIRWEYLDNLSYFVELFNSYDRRKNQGEVVAFFILQPNMILEECE